MKKVVIDANAFLRFLLDDIHSQKEIFEKLLNEAKSKKVILLVPQIIIFEIQFILDKYYHLQRQEIAEKLKTILSTKYLQIEEREILLSALIIYSQENISFVDCFLLTKTRHEKAEIFTHDKN